jgi:hypothetical protein
MAHYWMSKATNWFWSGVGLLTLTAITFIINYWIGKRESSTILDAPDSSSANSEEVQSQKLVVKKSVDKKAIVCNYAVATRACSLGARCYLINENPGWGGERVQILARSRGGIWIKRWEAAWRLHNFRFKTVPPGNPVYARVIDFSEWDESLLAAFNKRRDAERGGKLAQLAGLTKKSAHTD